VKLVPLFALPAAVGLAALGAIAPAHADTAGETTMTLGLSASGSLSISAPATASGSGVATPGSTVNVPIGTTTVIDNRGALTGWTVTASATDLVTGSGGAGEVIPVSDMAWTTGSIAASGSSVLTGVAAGAGGSLAAPVVVAASLPLSGAGTFSYPATVHVVVPPNVKAGTYVSTITQTVV
jgi:hypothetical protein